jgi:DNA polymerase III epsilon subunit-like protein
MNKYIAFDAETGGTETTTSLLTLYLCVLDEHFNVVADLDLKVKPNAGAPYVITAEALRINKINLGEHDVTASTEGECAQELRAFLWNHSMNGKVKLVPIGHNVGFDEDFIFAHLLGKKAWNNYVSYRKLDTAAIAQFLKASGKLPESVPGSLGSLVEHLNLRFDSAGAHNAKADTLATVDVLKEMLKL